MDARYIKLPDLKVIKYVVTIKHPLCTTLPCNDLQYLQSLHIWPQLELDSGEEVMEKEGMEKRTKSLL